MLRGLHRLALLAVIAGCFSVSFCKSASAAATFNVFVASFGNSTVYQLPDDFGGAAVGSGQIFANGFSGAPYSLASLNREVYIGQFNGDEKVYKKGAFDNTAGPGSVYVTVGSSVYDLDFADNNNLHVVGPSTTVNVYSTAQSLVGTYSFAATGTAGGVDYAPGDGVYVTRVITGGPNSVVRLTGSGSSFTGATSAGLAADTYTNFLQQIVKAPNGQLYMASYAADDTIYRIDPTTGAFVDLFPTSTITIGLTSYVLRPVGLDFGPDNKIYFTNYDGTDGGKLFRFSLDVNGNATGPELVATGFSNPVGITFVPLPEPATFGLAGVGLLVMLTRRKRS
jgi:hypothetical protein